MCSCAGSNLKGKHYFIITRALSRLDYFVCVCVCVHFVLVCLVLFPFSLLCSELR